MVIQRTNLSCNTIVYEHLKHNTMNMLIFFYNHNTPENIVLYVCSYPIQRWFGIYFSPTIFWFLTFFNLMKGHIAENRAKYDQLCGTMCCYPVQHLWCDVFRQTHICCLHFLADCHPIYLYQTTSTLLHAAIYLATLRLVLYRMINVSVLLTVLPEASPQRPYPGQCWSSPKPFNRLMCKLCVFDHKSTMIGLMGRAHCISQHLLATNALTKTNWILPSLDWINTNRCFPSML
jgi:hypothetical protein